MATVVLPTQYEPAADINYIGANPDYYGDGGPVVLSEVHTARISAYELDTLELASHGKVVVTTNATEKALEIGCEGVADPGVIDTAVIDSGDKNLRLATNGELQFAGQDLKYEAATSYHATVEAASPTDPTFHHYATASKMVMGTGVLDGNMDVQSGGFLQTTPDEFALGHGDAAIKSTAAGVATRVRYETAAAHEFFVGSDAASQLDGQGVIEVTANKVTIRRNVDLTGMLNSIATETTTLQVEDQIIRLAHTDDEATKNRDVLLSQDRTGLAIDTVPGSYADDAAYMGTFKAADGSKLFVDDDNTQILVDKANTSKVFRKEVAFYLNEGAKTAGKSTADSRLQEPYWNVSGGSFRMNRTVPAANGTAKNFGISFRITDAGDMEMVRSTKVLEWNETAQTYEDSATVQPTVSVIAKYLVA